MHLPLSALLNVVLSFNSICPTVAQSFGGGGRPEEEEGEGEEEEKEATPFLGESASNSVITRGKVFQIRQIRQFVCC